MPSGFHERKSLSDLGVSRLRTRGHRDPSEGRGTWQEAENSSAECFNRDKIPQPLLVSFNEQMSYGLCLGTEWRQC